MDKTVSAACPRKRASQPTARPLVSASKLLAHRNVGYGLLPINVTVKVDDGNNVSIDKVLQASLSKVIFVIIPHRTAANVFAGKS